MVGVKVYNAALRAENVRVRGLQGAWAQYDSYQARYGVEDGEKLLAEKGIYVSSI